MKTPSISASPLREEQSIRLSDSTVPIIRRLLTAAVALTLCAGATSSAQASLLATSGTLTWPGSLVTFSTFAVGLTSFSETPYTSFSLAWDGSAAPAWQGTVTGTGPYTAGPRPAGTTTFTFNGLSATYLPTGTYFGLSDLDAGTGPGEHITIRAFDTSNNLIVTPWLNDTVLVFAPSTTDGGGAPTAADMPAYDWNLSLLNGYTFDGSAIPGNPNINLLLTSAQNIGSIEVIRDNNSNSFGLAAPLPVPEPSTVFFGVASVLGILLQRNRKSTKASSLPE